MKMAERRHAYKNSKEFICMPSFSQISQLRATESNYYSFYSKELPLRAIEAFGYLKNSHYLKNSQNLAISRNHLPSCDKTQIFIVKQIIRSMAKSQQIAA